MKYLVVDGMVSGTGIRDAVEGGYLNPETLGLSENLLEKLKEWITEYEDEHYNSYKNSERINRLDETGIHLAKTIQLEMPVAKIEYYSAAKCKNS